MKLRTRILLLLAGVLLVVLVGSLGIVSHNLKQDISARVEGELARAKASFGSREALDFKLLTSLATTLEGNPSLRVMVNQTDRPTTEDFLEDVRAESGVDFIVLTDLEGRPNFNTQGSPTADQPLKLASIEQALEGYDVRDYWNRSQGVYRVYTLPFGYQGNVGGTLSMGFLIDKNRLTEAAKEMGVQLALMDRDSPLLSSEGLSPNWKATEYQTDTTELEGPSSIELLLAVELRPYEALLASTRWQLALLGGLVFLVAIALSAPLVRRLAAPAELLETVVETVGEGLCQLDNQGVVLLMNPEAEKLLGLPAQSGKGRRLLEEISFRPAQDTEALKPSDLDRPLQILDGWVVTPKREFPLSLALSPIVSHQEHAGAVIVFRDISERKANERELREAQAKAAQSSRLAAMGQLAAGVAHELNTPLGAVQLQLEGALRRPEKVDRVKKKLESSLGALEGMRKIVSQLLSHSANAPSAENALADLSQVVGDTLILLGPQMDKAGVSIEDRLAPKVVVRASAPELQQVLINLVTNARDATLSEGSRGQLITVTTEVVGERGVLRVADQGPGIPEEVKARLFEPFFTTKEVGKGTGLGLSVTRNLVDQNEGLLDVHSQPGEDTVFEVSFALGEAEPQGQAQASDKTG